MPPKNKNDDGDDAADFEGENLGPTQWREQVQDIDVTKTGSNKSSLPTPPGAPKDSK